MQVLRNERFLTGSGLTMAQRASYLSTLLGRFDSWRVLGLRLLPATALVLATSPISAPWGAFVTIFGVTFWCSAGRWCGWPGGGLRYGPRQSSTWCGCRQRSGLRSRSSPLDRWPSP
jgi:hypothetical protein